MGSRQAPIQTNHSRGAASLRSQVGSIQKVVSGRTTGKISGSSYHPPQILLPKVFSGSSHLTIGTAPKSASGAVRAVSTNNSGHGPKQGSKKRSSGAKGVASGASMAAVSSTRPGGRLTQSTGGASAVTGVAQGANPVHAPLTSQPAQLTPELTKKLKKLLLTVKNGEQSIETQR